MNNPHCYHSYSAICIVCIYYDDCMGSTDYSLHFMLDDIDTYDTTHWEVVCSISELVNTDKRLQ